MPSLMESIISLDVGAQEPWPNDVQLFQPYSMEQILLPDNANCLATQAYLHMCGLPFKIEHRANAEYMSPSGKVPFIKCGAFVVSELEPIVQFVANKGISLTADFDNEQKSDLRAYMSLIFSVLMNAELYICWCDKRTYNEVTKVRNGSVYPWPLNHYQNWTKRSAVIKKLKLLNWYQKTLGSVYQEVETCCQALSERLEGKEYFFGSKPTEVDALLYGHTYSIFSNPVEFPNLFVIFQRFPNLIIHCRRICFNYTVLRYIDFTKTDTDLDSSRESSTHNIAVESKKTLFTQFWNYITNKKCSQVSDAIASEIETDSNKIEQKSNDTNDISFKRTLEPCIKHKSTFDDDDDDDDVDAPKSINYLGHKVIQQHLQQDLRNKLSDFSIDTNSDIWSEKDLCYITSDRDLLLSNTNNFANDEEFDLDAYDTKQNLDTKSSSAASSTSSNISMQLDWLHGGSSSSTIDIHFSKKSNADSGAENKNDTLNDQENIEIDADWLTENTSDTKFDSLINDKTIQNDIVITFDTNIQDDVENINAELKLSNCSINDDDEKEKSAIDNEQNDVHDLDNKTSKIEFMGNDVDTDYILSKRCSTNTNNTNAWTTLESVSENNSEPDNMEFTVELINDMLNSVEQMNNNNNNNNSDMCVVELFDEKKTRSENNLQNDTPKSKSESEITIETYSDNHICNENCNNIYVANDDSFWDDDVSKSMTDEKTLTLDLDDQNKSNEIVEKKHSAMSCEKTATVNEQNIIDKISNESLKKYFSCESYRQLIGQVENCKSRSTVPVENVSNVIITVNQPYPKNEFLKLLTSDDVINHSTNNDEMLTPQNCNELFLEQNINVITNENEQNNAPKPRIFRKCRRLLNRSTDINNVTLQSDSKILQKFNEKLLEYRTKSINDIENIRMACSMLKNFNTNAEPCKACSLCKFSSNPNISHSCKCCDSNFSIKSKSVIRFSSVSTTFSSDQLKL